MPSIAKAQQEVLGELGNFTEDKGLFGDVTLSVVEKILVQYGAEFALKVQQYLAEAGQIGPNADLSKSLDPDVVTTGAESVLRIFLLEYYDYVNKGVKGVKSSKNAPGSPYQFRNYGVPDTMKESLRKSIQSGKAKVSTVRRDKAYGIGAERKGKRFTEEETKVNTLGYLIKRFGIKGSKYFDRAFDETFRDFDRLIGDALEVDIGRSFIDIKLGFK